MKETILLFGFSRERQGKIIWALLPLKMRIKRVEPDEMWQPLGAYVGLVTPEASADGTVQELGEEMLVMAGLTSARVDAVLAALRKGKIGPIPYKAVLTESNQRWNAFELLEELKKEHARFTAQTP